MTFAVGFVIYCALCVAGRPPAIKNVKHNQFFGLFFARFLVWLIGPLERLLIGRVSPNAITVASLLLCAITGAAVALGHLAGAVWLYVFAGILDVLDGRLARLTNQQTQAGALFDSVSDRWGELFVFAGFTWYLHDSVWLLAVLAATGGSMMVSYTRARAESLGVDQSGGVMQRAERIVLVVGGTMIAAWYGSNADTASLVGPILGVTMLICGVASTGTAINRWVHAYRELVQRVEAGALAAAASDASDAVESIEPIPALPTASVQAQVLRQSHVRKIAPLA
jgi:CDP-diacylglycerol---glycerol-3-phosphate 3-phosphatidyltransferase